MKQYTLPLWMKKVIHDETVHLFAMKRYTFCDETVHLHIIYNIVYPIVARPKNVDNFSKQETNLSSLRSQISILVISLSIPVQKRFAYAMRPLQG